MKNWLASFLMPILMFSVILNANAANSTQLLHEPDETARVLADRINTADLYIIENNGAWSRVLNTKTGLVGWAKMPPETENENETDIDTSTPDEENTQKDADEDETEVNINGMVLAHKAAI